MLTQPAVAGTRSMVDLLALEGWGFRRHKNKAWPSQLGLSCAWQKLPTRWDLASYPLAWARGWGLNPNKAASVSVGAAGC